MTESTKKAARCFYAPLAGTRRLEALPGHRSLGVLLEIPRNTLNPRLPRRASRRSGSIGSMRARPSCSAAKYNDQINILGDRRRAGRVPRAVLEVGADRLSGSCSGTPSTTSTPNCAIAKKMMYEMVLDVCGKSFGRRFRGVLAVLQGADQPLPTDELFGVEVREIPRLPQADRSVCGRKNEISHDNTSISEDIHQD